MTTSKIQIAIHNLIRPFDSLCCTQCLKEESV
uniref:Uncharacterized protein n=1 Tax=Rhizophora mucronata TaxID=61149 RepID=A0A2P2P6D1_RHIMU